MKRASNEIIETLKERGYRITDARTQVAMLLASAKTPLSIQTLAGKVAVDEVSVYRTIDLLLKEGLVEEIHTAGGTRYAHFHGHHHHVICTTCETVVHIPCDREPKAPPKVAGFTAINSHALTFYGLCKKCA